MEKRVKSLVGRILGRNSFHQFRINNGKNRNQPRSPKPNLLVRIQIRDNTPTVDLRTCAGRSGNCHNGKSWIHQGLSFSGSAAYIVPQITGICRHCGNRFGRIQDRTTAKRKDKITALFPCKGSAFHNHLFPRILHNFTKHCICNAGLCELLGYAVKGTVDLRRVSIGE